MKTKIILVLTLPRSGSNHFNNLFTNFKNISVNYELFNQNECYCSKKNKNLIIKKYGENYLEITKNKKKSN